ncbi:hypothetical protein FPV67DRAFT_901219 [Lyophyllum atratum]|nr:hypothetical protein FPV67DRAFT_901219 [Lyophyllum atratum]
MEKSFQAQPDIFKAPHHPFQVEVWHENALTKATLDSFLNTVSDGIIGMAPAYGVKCALTSLALSSQTHVLFIRLSTSKASHRSRKQKDSIGRAFLQELLLDQSIRKHAFKMDKLAAALYTDLRIHIANGLDLLSVAKGDDRQSLSALMFVLGGEVKLNKPQVIKLFEQEEKDTGNISDTAAQAWAACQAAFIEITSKQLANSLKINTHILDETHLVVLAKIVRDGDRLVAQKPTRQKNEVDKKYSHKQGNLNLTSTRFRTRVMRLGEKQTVEVQTIGQRGANRISAKVLGVNGRAAFLSVQGHFSGTLRSITTVGRESLTMSEAIRGEIVLRALQQTNESVMKHPFVQRIWLPAFKVSWKNTPSSTIPVAISFPPPRKLNTSQTMAVKAILSNNALDRITMIHGPPGTGKTTVIAAAVTSILNSPDRTRTIWLVAQSNVAVKNIAEKLVDVGVVAFRLLVSKDFHYDWHEHLYQQIEEKIIRSDNFVEDVMAAERLLLGSRVILCTLIRSKLAITFLPCSVFNRLFVNWFSSVMTNSSPRMVKMIFRNSVASSRCHICGGVQYF